MNIQKNDYCYEHLVETYNDYKQFIEKQKEIPTALRGPQYHKTINQKLDERLIQSELLTQRKFLRFAEKVGSEKTKNIIETIFKNENNRYFRITEKMSFCIIKDVLSKYTIEEIINLFSVEHKTIEKEVQAQIDFIIKNEIHELSLIKKELYESERAKKLKEIYDENTLHVTREILLDNLIKNHIVYKHL